MNLNPLKIDPRKLNPLKQFRKKSKYTSKIGMPPGQIYYLGDKEGPVKIKLIKYNESDIREIDIEDFDHLEKEYDPAMNNWINLDGINDEALMQKIVSKFNFHPLMAEDILNTEHFPKSEEYELHHFFTLKMVRLLNQDHSEIIQEHLSLVLGPNYVLTFQDNLEGDVFDPVRMRLSQPKTRIRKNGSDYLFYALIDAVVDQYFTVMEYVREKIEDLEDYVLENPDKKLIDHIIGIKKQLTTIRKVVVPLKDAIDRLFIDDSEFITENTYVYLRDIQDHTMHLTTSFDSFRESVASLMDMYMSNLSNNLNVIMKTLTIFSLFFVPLTFIAGVYGMNFRYMPELEWRYGYPLVIGIMLLTVIFLFIFMRSKKWL